jgi:hypothetical protein
MPALPSSLFVWRSCRAADWIKPSSATSCCARPELAGFSAPGAATARHGMPAATTFGPEDIRYRACCASPTAMPAISSSVLIGSAGIKLLERRQPAGRRTRLDTAFTSGNRPARLAPHPSNLRRRVSFRGARPRSGGRSLLTLLVGDGVTMSWSAQRKLQGEARGCAFPVRCGAFPSCQDGNGLAHGARARQHADVEGSGSRRWLGPRGRRGSRPPPRAAHHVRRPGAAAPWLSSCSPQGPIGGPPGRMRVSAGRRPSGRSGRSRLDSRRCPDGFTHRP